MKLTLKFTLNENRVLTRTRVRVARWVVTFLMVVVINILIDSLLWASLIAVPLVLLTGLHDWRVEEREKRRRDRPATRAAAGHILADLDLAVLSDLFPDKGYENFEGNFGEHAHECFYVGMPEDLSAGLRGGAMSGPFDSLDDLYEWVTKSPNLLAIRVASDKWY